MGVVEPLSESYGMLLTSAFDPIFYSSPQSAVIVVFHSLHPSRLPVSSQSSRTTLNVEPIPTGMRSTSVFAVGALALVSTLAAPLPKAVTIYARRSDVSVHAVHGPGIVPYVLS